MLLFLDYFFIIFHSLFTLFNIFGWIFKKTRKTHIIAIALTAASWFVLGIWYGLGYCVCTDWHWQIRIALGNPPTSYSYIHFLILEVTGIDLPQDLVDIVTLWAFLFFVCMSLILNGRDLYLWHKKHD